MAKVNHSSEVGIALRGLVVVIFQVMTRKLEKSTVPTIYLPTCELL